MTARRGPHRTEDPEAAAVIAARLAAALEKARLPYAIGGALAYGRYGVPRTTYDVDLNIFVELDRAPRLVEVMTKAGVAFEKTPLARAESEGMMIGHAGLVRVDFFLPSIPFAHEAANTRVRHRVGRRQVWYLAAEAIAVFKLLFFRGKDMLDLERMVATMGKKLDVAYVRRWMVDMMGEADERVVKWDAIVKTYS